MFSGVAPKPKILKRALQKNLHINRSFGYMTGTSPQGAIPNLVQLITSFGFQDHYSHYFSQAIISL